MSDEGGWQALPPRARTLFLLTHGLGLGVPALVVLALVASQALRHALAPAAAAAALVLVVIGMWAGLRRYRYTRWMLDDTGFGYRRGRLWLTETRVPRTRVQHVDLKRGPMERHFGLATLVVHTAGTRASAVSVAGLDAGEAARLRDALARQADDDDDDDAPVAA